MAGLLTRDSKTVFLIEFGLLEEGALWPLASAASSAERDSGRYLVLAEHKFSSTLRKTCANQRSPISSQQTQRKRLFTVML